jgi:hypothetical protein
MYIVASRRNGTTTHVVIPIRWERTHGKEATTTELPNGPSKPQCARRKGSYKPNGTCGKPANVKCIWRNSDKKRHSSSPFLSTPSNTSSRRPGKNHRLSQAQVQAQVHVHVQARRPRPGPTRPANGNRHRHRRKRVAADSIRSLNMGSGSIWPSVSNARSGRWKENHPLPPNRCC